ncbi:MAG: LysM domain-containing protein [Chloroflexi bacterium]|nr:LysM domain-containing protein [Chloroflexota bacterium]
MFDTNSRYYKIEQGTLSVSDRDGQPREIRYVRRRFIPPPETMTTLVEHKVLQGERLDNITARYLSDPTLFWRVCDANDVIVPEELETVGRLIRIAMATQ